MPTNAKYSLALNAAVKPSNRNISVFHKFEKIAQLFTPPPLWWLVLPLATTPPSPSRPSSPPARSAAPLLLLRGHRRRRVRPVPPPVHVDKLPHVRALLQVLHELHVLVPGRRPLRLLRGQPLEPPLAAPVAPGLVSVGLLDQDHVGQLLRLHLLQVAVVHVRVLQIVPGKGIQNIIQYSRYRVSGNPKTWLFFPPYAISPLMRYEPLYE